MAEPNISGSNSGGGSLGDSSTPVVGTGKSGFGSVIKEAEQFKRVLGGITAGMEKLTDASRKAGAAIKGTMGGRGSGHKASLASGYNAPMSNGSADDDTSKPGYMSRMLSGAGLNRSGGGGGGNAARYEAMSSSKPLAAANAFGAVAQGIGQVVGAGVGVLDARIARGYEYSSSADKMSVMYQQITGMSNAGVRNAYRQPLTNYRLGEGGINTLLGMQASTGISALGNASSVEGLNALSGYSLGAQGVTNMLTNMGSAQTANRMFMTSGMSIYKPGGGQRSGTELIQNLARSSGLTGLKNIEGALQQGSNTRARLADMGVDSATQDLVIQYAMANQQYGAKGGKGMYDPSSAAQRKMMGIEDNFATQIEETTRVKTDREEDFYGTQEKSFAKLEKTTQSLEKTFGKLEERMKDIIGMAIETKPKRGMLGGVLKTVGPIMSAVGLGVMAGVGWTGVGAGVGAAMVGAGAGLGAIGTAMGGDPGPGKNKPTWGKTGDPNTSGGSGKMHPTMQQRVDQLIAASGGKVGLGTGYRSSAQQETMFRSRYRKTSSPTDADGKKNWVWDGSYWEHVSGAQAAPPGRSMHEIGLAADLTGDMNWVTANAARFGLKHFSSMGEPWHVQPVELPNGRSEYDKAGRPWGGEPMSASTGPSLNAEHGGNGNDSSGTGTTASGVTLASLSGLSMSESIAAFRAGGLAGSTGLSGGSGSPRKRRGVSTSTTPSKSGGQLTGEDVARYAYNAGFRGENLVKAVAIAYRESRWNAGSYNPNAATKDLSFGLMQINMIDNLGPSRRTQFGISSNEELYDPAVNMRAAFKMSGGTDFYAWGSYKGKDPMYSTNPDAARQAVVNAGFKDTGDPDMRSSARGSGASISTFKSGSTFNIAPVINVNSSGNSYVDAEVIAREVTMILEREIRIKELRMA
jgi:hypothetical protein